MSETLTVAESQIFTETLGRMRNIRKSLITKCEQDFNKEQLGDADLNVDRALLYAVVEVVALSNDMTETGMHEVMQDIVNAVFNTPQVVELEQS